MVDYAGRKVTHDIAEQFREEGRREILRKIVEIIEHHRCGPWLEDDVRCMFTPLGTKDRCWFPNHAPDCFWLRAQSVAGGEK